MRKSSVNEMTATMGTIAVGGTLRKPPLQRNPGDFDYGGYLRRQGFGAEVEATYAYVVDDSAPLHRRVLIRARGAVASAIESATPSPGGRAVLVALLLGDRSGLDIELQNNLARTGLRSEEHTSELQSRGHLVCRLLLEKKNQYTNKHS